MTTKISYNSFVTQAQSSQLNLVPFIDVLLVLVVLLMTSASALQQTVLVDLPSTTPQETAQRRFTSEPLVVSLSKDKQLYLEHALFPRQELTAQMLLLRLKAFYGQDVGEKIFVLADKQCQYEDVMAMIELIQQAGFTQVTLVSAKEAQKFL